MDAKKLSPANLVIVIAGVVMLIGSFLDFWEFGPFGESAWSGDTLFPVTIIPVLAGVAMGVHAALTTFGSVALPERVLGLGWNQIHLALGLHAAIMMVAFLLQDISPADKAIGFWLMLLSAIALAVGAFMRQQESARTV